MIATSPFSFDYETILDRPEIGGLQNLVPRLQEIGRAHNEWFKLGRGADNVAKLNSSLIKDCGHNFGLLMPFVFPRYPIDRPLQFEKRPFMMSMASLLTPMTLTLNAGRQVGKCVEGETELEVRQYGGPPRPLTIQQMFESTPACPDPR